MSVTNNALSDIATQIQALTSISTYAHPLLLHTEDEAASHLPSWELIPFSTLVSPTGPGGFRKIITFRAILRYPLKDTNFETFLDKYELGAKAMIKAANESSYLIAPNPDLAVSIGAETWMGVTVYFAQIDLEASGPAETLT